jgi:D-alanyl-D-alanine carboxypeptidase
MKFRIGQAELFRRGPFTAPSQSSPFQPLPIYGYLPCGNVFAPVNKRYSLSPDCVPFDLVTVQNNIGYLKREANDALNFLILAGQKDGVHLVPVSAFRDYKTQENVFNYHVQTLGLQEAERQSAKPGHSEHQLGTTVDVTSDIAMHRALVNRTSPLVEFIGTLEAKWLEENAWKYGFIVSYPYGKESITGYMYEPWHIRYVTREVAARVAQSGITLGEYLLRSQ